MGFFSKIAGKIAGLLGKKKPTPAKKQRDQGRFGRTHGGGTYGNLGVAAGSLKPRADFATSGKTEADLSPENVAKWRSLTKEEAEGFLNGEILFVHSSNVAAMQWHEETSQLMVEFLNGSAYLYDNCDERIAVEALNSFSKGNFIWNEMRVRGSKTAHKRPYRRLR